MTTTNQLADFILQTSYSDCSNDVIDRAKKRILDSLGIAIGALGEEPVEIVKDTVVEMDEEGPCGLWGSHTGASPSQAAMYNTALVRYLDYMDSYLAPGETPHPSDNIAAAIVCGEYDEQSGEDLIEAVVVAYEIQGALAWAAPVRDRGWDHVTHTIFSATAAASKILGLDHSTVRNALGIAGTAHNALRVTRTGGINMWKGIASANTARNAVYSTFLAKNGMEGPTNVFEGQKGWKQIVSGDFEVELTPGERIHHVMCKKYVAETYAQSAIEGIVELVEREDIDPREIDAIHLDTFHGAKLIIGGGEGSRYEVQTKAQADHSLPYMLAVAALDGTVMNQQYETERIREDDVQSLLKQVTVEEDPELTERFEDGEMPARITVTTDAGQTFTTEKSDFEGHPNNPMDWDQIVDKFRAITGDVISRSQQNLIVDLVRKLEDSTLDDLVTLLQFEPHSTQTQDQSGRISHD